MPKKFNLYPLALLLFALNLLLGAFLLWPAPKTDREPEITAMLQAKNTPEKLTLYRRLIERVGVKQAQEDLFLSGLPFTGETHLLNHLSGDYLYKTEGLAGILNCKDYFLSSCHHGLILNAIAKEGTESLSKIMDICYERGNPVSVQCAHGIGHGLLAWLGYKKLPAALMQCEFLHTQDPSFPIFNCQDGIFMENLWAVHEDGKPSRDRWIREKERHYPCTEARLKESWRDACWSNQPSVMYQMFKGDLSQTAEGCEEAPEKYRDMCFNGLARQIHPLTKGKVREVFSLCALLPENRRSACASTIATSDYAVGGRKLPFEICAQSPAENKETCYQNLFSIMRTYQNAESAEKTCSPIQEKKGKDLCLSSLKR